MSKKSKKLNLKTALQTDGKLEKENENGEYEITSLDQLWGFDGTGGRYQTLDTEEYTNELEELNSAELRRHAIEVAHVVPSTSVERLKKRLILEHKKYVSAFRTPKHQNKKDKPPSKEVLKIMSEVK